MSTNFDPAASGAAVAANAKEATKTATDQAQAATNTGVANAKEATKNTTDQAQAMTNTGVANAKDATKAVTNQAQTMTNAGSAVAAHAEEAGKATTEQAHVMLNAGAENFAIWQRLGSVWLQNRSNDFSDAAAAAKRLASCTGPEEFMEAYSEWVNSRMQRFSEETGTYQECLKSIGARTEKTVEDVGNKMVSTADTFTKKSTDAMTPKAAE